MIWVENGDEVEVAVKIHFKIRFLTPPMETPDPPNDTPGASKQVLLTPHDIPWSLTAKYYVGFGCMCFYILISFDWALPFNPGSLWGKINIDIHCDSV